MHAPWKLRTQRSSNDAGNRVEIVGQLMRGGHEDTVVHEDRMGHEGLAQHSLRRGDLLRTLLRRVGQRRRSRHSCDLTDAPSAQSPTPD